LQTVTIHIAKLVQPKIQIKNPKLVGNWEVFPAPGDIAAVIREQGGAPLARAQVELLTSQNVFAGHF
jgi:hypothetical protein